MTVGGRLGDAVAFCFCQFGATCDGILEYFTSVLHTLVKLNSYAYAVRAKNVIDGDVESRKRDDKESLSGTAMDSTGNNCVRLCR